MNSFLNNMFTKKPTTNDIVKRIANFNPSLMDNDRAFCYLFDKIALANGYQEYDLPSYWTIGRTIYNYKQSNNISAENTAPKTNELIKNVDLNNPLLSAYKFLRKPSIHSIIEKISEYDDYALQNDRKLVELFDSIALLNGYSKNNLPKYWNIIRASFRYKRKQKEYELC